MIDIGYVKLTSKFIWGQLGSLYILHSGLKWGVMDTFAYMFVITVLLWFQSIIQIHHQVWKKLPNEFFVPWIIRLKWRISWNIVSFITIIPLECMCKSLFWCYSSDLRVYFRILVKYSMKITFDFLNFKFKLNHFAQVWPAWNFQNWVPNTNKMPNKVAWYIGITPIWFPQHQT